MFAGKKEKYAVWDEIDVPDNIIVVSGTARTSI